MAEYSPELIPFDRHRSLSSGTHMDINAAIAEQQWLQTMDPINEAFNNENLSQIASTHDYLAVQTELLVELENTKDFTERAKLSDALQELERLHPELDEQATAIRLMHTKSRIVN
jgi:hypothetical protein